MASLIKTFPRFSLLKRFWMLGGLVAAFVLTAVVANFVIAKDKSIGWKTIGNDFIVFYTAGRFVHDGHMHDLYDLPRVQAFEDKVSQETGRAKGIGPIWNPPFVAWMLQPLGRFDFDNALLWWYALSLACFLGSVFIIVNWLPHQAGTSGRVFVVAMVLVSEPLIKAFAHGQNTFISLFLLTGTVMLWRARKAFAAGLLAGLLFYKPQLGAIVAIVLTCTLGWRALAGILITIFALLAINIFLMPGTLGEFYHQMPANLRWMQFDRPYQWNRHITFVAFWRMIFQGDSVGTTWMIARAMAGLSTLAVAAGMFFALRTYRTIQLAGDARERDRALDLIIAATIVCSPLLMPFYFDYDLLLLLIPAVLVGRDMSFGNRDLSLRADIWLPWVFAMLYVGTYFNVASASAMRVSISVVVLSVLAGLMIRRIGRPGLIARSRQKIGNDPAGPGFDKKFHAFAFHEAA